MQKMPVVFVGHGSPMNVVSDNDFTRSLVDLGRELARPKAIMVISAHWLTSGTFVTCDRTPKTIHDFYGFPEELYLKQYPAPGSPEVADRVIQIVKKPGISCGDWGLDHASWLILKHMYPKADVPTFEMSLDYTKSAQYHYDWASQLAPLREEGILIIGSGNLVHNIRAAQPDIDAEPYDWAVEFDEIVKENLINRYHQNLIDYPKYGRLSSLAIPTNDHYLPMIYAIALQEQNEPITFVYEGFQHSAASMRCFKIG